MPNFYSTGLDSIRLSQMIECEDLKEEKKRLESEDKKMTDLEIWEKSALTNKNRFEILPIHNKLDHKRDSMQFFSF